MPRRHFFFASGLLLALVMFGPSSSVALDTHTAPVPDAPRPQDACGSYVTAEEGRAFLEKWEAESGMPDRVLPAGPHYVSIAPHIVRRTDGSGGLAESRYEDALADANAAYAATGMVFYTLGAIDYIDDDAFYSGISTLAEINDLRTTNTVPDAINIYFTEVLAYENGSLCGISAFTTSSVQAIAMRNSCTATATNHSTFPHEIGHYFDLFHTHEPYFGDELVDGSNCDVAGDLLCDTPADPRLGSGNVTNACEYVGGETDANGDPYAPDPAQYMSYSLKHCRDTFTPDGEAKALSTLLNDRPNLISPLTGVIGSGNGAPEAVDGAGLRLDAPRPNPTRGGVLASYALDAPAFVEITVHDIRGGRVASLRAGLQAAGEHTLRWSGRDAGGAETAAGIYFVRVKAAGREAVRRVHRVR